MAVSYITFCFCKVRAASVLRKAKDDDEVNKSEVTGNNGGNRSQEMMALERMVEALNTKIGDLRSVEHDVYRVAHLVGWIELTLMRNVPSSSAMCTQLVVSISHVPKKNWAEGGTAKIKVKPWFTR